MIASKKLHSQLGIFATRFSLRLTRSLDSTQSEDICEWFAVPDPVGRSSVRWHMAHEASDGPLVNSFPETILH